MNDLIIIPVIDKKRPGHYAIIDAADAELVSQYRWYLRTGHGHISAGTTVMRDGKRVSISLHRLIMNPPADIEIDHWNRDALDCRRSNMREATRLQNSRNRKHRKDAKSPYKCVYLRSYCRKFEAYIYINKKRTLIGFFDTPEEAARAYDAAARLHFGEFACLNFPQDGEVAA